MIYLSTISSVELIDRIKSKKQRIVFVTSRKNTMPPVDARTPFSEPQGGEDDVHRH
jgi:hypothetical protein